MKTKTKKNTKTINEEPRKPVKMFVIGLEVRRNEPVLVHVTRLVNISSGTSEVNLLSFLFVASQQCVSSTATVSRSVHNLPRSVGRWLLLC